MEDKTEIYGSAFKAAKMLIEEFLFSTRID